MGSGGICHYCKRTPCACVLSASEVAEIVSAYGCDSLGRSHEALKQKIVCERTGRLLDDCAHKEVVSALRADNERLRADAELGALVDRMPEGSALVRTPSGGGWTTGRDGFNFHGDRHDTAEAALRAALGEEA